MTQPNLSNKVVNMEILIKEETPDIKFKDTGNLNYNGEIKVEKSNVEFNSENSQHSIMKEDDEFSEIECNFNIKVETWTQEIFHHSTEEKVFAYENYNPKIKRQKMCAAESPFVCEFCGYKTTHKSHLQLHIRTHTGEKPYICTICDYKCVDKSNLRRHLKIHNGK